MHPISVCIHSGSQLDDGACGLQHPRDPLAIGELAVAQGACHLVVRLRALVVLCLQLTVGEARDALGELTELRGRTSESTTRCRRSSVVGAPESGGPPEPEAAIAGASLVILKCLLKWSGVIPFSCSAALRGHMMDSS